MTETTIEAKGESGALAEFLAWAETQPADIRNLALLAAEQIEQAGDNPLALKTAAETVERLSRQRAARSRREG